MQIQYPEPAINHIIVRPKNTKILPPQLSLVHINNNTNIPIYFKNTDGGQTVYPYFHNDNFCTHGYNEPGCGRIELIFQYGMFRIDEAKYIEAEVKTLHDNYIDAKSKNKPYMLEAMLFGYLNDPCRTDLKHHKPNTHGVNDYMVVFLKYSLPERALLENEWVGLWDMGVYLGKYDFQYEFQAGE